MRRFISYALTGAWLFLVPGCVSERGPENQVKPEIGNYNVFSFGQQNLTLSDGRKLRVYGRARINGAADNVLEIEFPNGKKVRYIDTFGKDGEIDSVELEPTPTHKETLYPVTNPEAVAEGERHARAYAGIVKKADQDRRNKDKAGETKINQGHVVELKSLSPTNGLSADR